MDKRENARLVRRLEYLLGLVKAKQWQAVERCVVDTIEYYSNYFKEKKHLNDG